MAQRTKWFYGWTLVIIGFILYFLQGGVPVGVFFKPMLEEFGWTRTVLSSVQSFGMILMAFTGPIVGKLVDKFGPKAIMVLGSVGIGVSRILNGIAGNIWHLYLARVGMVISVMRGIPVLLNRWFFTKRGLALAISSSGLSLGQVILAPLTTYLILVYGWRSTYLIWAVIPLIIAPILLILIKNHPRELGSSRDGRSEKTIHNTLKQYPVTDTEGLSFTVAIKTRVFWLHAVGHLICGLGCGFMMTHLIPFATDLGFSEMEAAGALSLLSGTNIIGILVTGWISDRVGRQTALVFTHFIRSLSFLIAVVGVGPWSLYVMSMFFGFGYFTTDPLTSGLVADLFGETAMGSLIGLSNTTHSIGSAIGAVAGGLVFDVTKSYYLYFLVMTPLSFTAAITYLFVRSKT